MYNNKINNKLKTGNWIVFYYSEHCGYCVDFMPLWEKFVKLKTPNIQNKIKIKSENSQLVKINPGFQGVPTIHFYKNGKYKNTFTKERTLENLVKFYKVNSKTKNTKTKKTKKKNRNKKQTKKN